MTRYMCFVKACHLKLDARVLEGCEVMGESGADARALSAQELVLHLLLKGIHVVRVRLPRLFIALCTTFQV